MAGELISEPITPAPGSSRAAGAITGAPAFPACFVWRDREYELARVLRTWKDTGPCKHGSDERYVRKHLFEVLTTTGERMNIYFERQPRSSRQAAKRWWLYTLSESAPGGQQAGAG